MVAVAPSVLKPKAVFPPQILKFISAQEEELMDEYLHLWNQTVRTLMMGSERLFFFLALLIYNKASFRCAESPAGVGCQGL